jgi:WD40 repeat protein
MGMIGQVILAAVADPKSGDTGYIQRWDLSTGVSLGAPLKEFYAGSSTNPVALYPPNTLLHSWALSCLNTKNSSLNYHLIGKERPVHRYFGQDRLCSLCISPDSSHLVAGNEEGKVMAWEIISGEMVVFLEGAHLQRVTKVALSSDGEYLVTSSADGTAKVWSWTALLAGEGTSTWNLDDHTDMVTDVHIGFGIDRNCRMVTACRDKQVRLYDLVDAHLLACFEFPSAVLKVKMTAAETLIFAACEDGNIYIVDLAADSGEISEQTAVSYSQRSERTRLAGHKSAVVSIELSMDEECLISGDAEGNVLIWNISTRQIMRRLATDGYVRWIGVVHKTSFEAALDQKTRLVAGQPKRAMSSDQSSWAVLVPEPTVITEKPATVVDTKEIDELRAGYSQLIDHVFAKY